MTQIVSPPLQAGQFVGESPATGIVAAVASDGTVKVLSAWDPVQGDVTYTAAAGSVGGGGTRVHRFGTAVAVNGPVSATGSITVVGTTGFVYMIAQNTSGNTLVGVEGSAPGTLTPGSLAYASLMGSNTATALQFFTSNLIRLTLSASGAVIAGTDPGGTELLRVGGGARFGGTVTATSSLTVSGTTILTSATSVVGITNTAAAGVNVFIQMTRGSTVAGYIASDASDNLALLRGADGAVAVTINRSTGALTFTAYGTGGAVTVGAADSGGTGFKLLRVPN